MMMRAMKVNAVMTGDYRHYLSIFLALASESERKGSNTPSIRSLVVDDERIAGWQEGYPAHRTPFY